MSHARSWQASRNLPGAWGSMPYLYATNTAHIVMGHFDLTSLTPDLRELMPSLKSEGHRMEGISPDGSTLGWSGMGATELLDANTFLPREHLTDASPSGVSSSGSITTNRYPVPSKDKFFVTFTDAKTDRLVFHTPCTNNNFTAFLSDTKILVGGCRELKILDLEGNVLRQSRVDDGPVTFAGVSQNGKRFALVYVSTRGHWSVVQKESCVIYDTETAQPVSLIHVSDLPRSRSWSALSADGRLFVAGNPQSLSLYELP
jgi:hypothetical protein